MEQKNTAQTVAELVQQLAIPRSFPLPDGNEVLLAPEGLKVHQLRPFMDPYRLAPERRCGTAVFTDEASFIDHANRFRDADSVVFVDENEAQPALTSVLNYNRVGADGAPQFGDHRGHYAPKLSKPWKTWAEREKQAMGVAEFALFLQDNLADVVNPPAEGSDDPGDKLLLQRVADFGSGGFADKIRLLELSRGLRVRENAQVVDMKNVNTGEVELVYKTSLQDENGQPLAIPGAFLIAVPVFHRGPVYKMLVRIRMKRVESAVRWSIERYRPDVVFEHALEEILARVAEKTTLPVLRGAPER